MPHSTLHPLDHAVQNTSEWLADVAAEFETDDREFVYRVSRAWLHCVRDGLPVPESAHVAAQLPTILRGVYFEGWDPSEVPVRMHLDAFVSRFAAEAHVARTEVPKVTWAVSSALDRRLGGLDKILNRFPAELRALLVPNR